MYTYNISKTINYRNVVSRCFYHWAFYRYIGIKCLTPLMILLSIKIKKLEKVTCT